jgi:putative hemolysin
MFFKKDEISKILEDFKNYAYKDKEFLQFMRGLRSLYEKSIEEVMKPMVDVIVVSEDNSLEEMVERFVKYRYSKYPVISYEGDKIVGIAHIKDVIMYLDRIKNLTVKEISRKAHLSSPLYELYEGAEDPSKKPHVHGIGCR